MLMFFELLAALAFGFVLGRLWEIRQEMRRAGETHNRIATARLDCAANRPLERCPNVRTIVVSVLGAASRFVMRKRVTSFGLLRLSF